MKSYLVIAITVFGSWLLLALGWLGSGCASRSMNSSTPKPGSGIAEYREVARQAHRSVAATVRSLEALAQPPARSSAPHPALPGFDRAFHQLELTSVKARARAEAIMARGQTYFDEWEVNLSRMTNATTASAEAERYSRLREHFERVRQRSGEVREEFRPFMSKLREFRAHLDKPANATGDDSSRAQLEGVTAGGRRVLQTLESVSTALDEAETALRATLAAKR
jgi:hypothetical protein